VGPHVMNFDGITRLGLYCAVLGFVCGFNDQFFWAFFLCEGGEDEGEEEIGKPVEELHGRRACATCRAARDLYVPLSGVITRIYFRL
jgi:hypothetical protein